MKECEVRENCKNYIKAMDKCWICDDYKLYNPEDKKILSPRQIRVREENKIEKKEKKSSEASKRGKRAKKKGYAGEHEIVQLLNKYNIPAERVPLSGALKGRLAGDVNCIIHGKEKKIEVKRRKSGFKTIYKYLEQDNSDFVFMREDRNDWIVCMKFDKFLDLVKGDK